MTNIAQRVRQFLRQVNRLPGRTTQIERNLARLANEVREHRREAQLLLDALALPSAEVWRNQPPLIPGEPAEAAFAAAAMCRQDSFREPYFSYWTARLGEGLRYHRKLWEFVFICQALWERGVVTSGRRGLGLANTRRRLQTQYGASGRLEAGATPQGYTARIILPLAAA